MSDTEYPPNRRRCSACKHSDHDAINAALEKKVPLREIARRFGVSKDAARRHRRHIPVQPDPLTAEIPPCPYHGYVPFWLEGSEWVCGTCSAWDGTLAYFRMPE